MSGRPPGRGRGGGAGGSAPRATERGAQTRSRRSMTPAAVWLIAFSAAMGLVLGVFDSELFAVRSVLVDSADESLAAEAAERAEQLSFGTIWLPPMREIESLIGGLPRAKTVQVERDLPSTLKIVVQPRSPVAVVHGEDRLMVIDEDGACMHWTGSAPEGLPQVRIESPSSLRVGGRLSRRDVEMLNAVRSGFAETGRLDGARIDLSRPVRIEVWTADGVLGKLGNPEMLPEKALLFGKLLETLEEQGEAPLYIDLRVPSRPTYKRVD
ncbi:MAG: cell division protein FtsQ/DivIB [Armatimonadota bacterium]|jgi:cell division protein FtsQ